MIGIVGFLFYWLYQQEQKEEANQVDSSISGYDELMELARDTYAFFVEFTDERTGLTADRVDLFDGEDVYEQTSPTNIAMYALSLVGAVELGFETKGQASEKIAILLNTLDEMKTWNGLYYNWYYTHNGELMNDWGQFISTVDNGWLTAALMVVSEYFPEHDGQAEQLVSNMDYSKLYSKSVGQFHGGYDVAEGKLTDHHYGLLYSETRITSYVAIGKEDVPQEHWWKLYRTFLPEDTWQAQVPTGDYVKYDGHSIYQGHYEYEGIQYVPSWGGSMFEALMPALLIDEKSLAPQGLGYNNEQHVKAQIKYAELNDWDIWGFSPAAIEGNYLEFGVPVLGAGEGYPDNGTVTSHASLLALEYAFEEVLSNVATLKEYGAYGEFGLYDTVSIQSGKVHQTYLALDQGMILASIVNYLTDGRLRHYFHQHDAGEKPMHLLKEEQFILE